MQKNLAREGIQSALVDTSAHQGEEKTMEKFGASAKKK